MATFAKLFEFSLAIDNLGGGHYFWGFIDSILNAICCPVIDQLQFYSTYKQKYGYKFQSIITLNGLVSNLMGLFLVGEVTRRW